MIFDIIEQSGFDNHFKNEGLQLEDLLADENILTEMKNLNPSLLQYLESNSEMVIEKLITFITTIPSPGDTYDRCYRLPYISSEMLAIDNDLFYCAFLGKCDHTLELHEPKDHFKNLERLFSFLGDPQRVNNQVLLGYFQKVVCNLYVGRKSQFSRAVLRNSQLFLKNMDKESIGTILKKCLILLDTPEGVLLNQRITLIKQIINVLNQILQTEKLSKNTIKTFEIGANIINQVIGKYRTFSSGQQIISILFDIKGQGHNSDIIKLIKSPKKTEMFDSLKLQVYNFVTGMLTQTKQKIFSIELDDYEFIMKYPIMMKEYLCKFIGRQLKYCVDLEHQETNRKIKYQNKESVRPISKVVFGYFKMISSMLDNRIYTLFEDKVQGQPVYNSAQILEFAISILQSHPKNDVLLVNIDKILNYGIRQNKNSQYWLYTQFKLYQTLLRLYQTNPKVYRPHLFHIWLALKEMKLIDEAATKLKGWSHMNTQFQELFKLYNKKPNVTTMDRPKDAKLVIDQQDMITKAVQQDHEKMSKSSHCHVAYEQAHDQHEIKGSEAKKIDEKKSAKFDPFANFAAFAGTSKTDKIEKKEPKKQEKKTADVDFSAFTNF